MINFYFVNLEIFDFKFLTKMLNENFYIKSRFLKNMNIYIWELDLKLFEFKIL